MSKKLNASFDTTRHVYDHCLCFAAQRAARALARRFDEALSPLGLTSGQFSLLTSLNQPEPPAMGSIAALLVMDRTTLTANLKPLQQRGFLRRLGELQIDDVDRLQIRLACVEAAFVDLQFGDLGLRNAQRGGGELTQLGDGVGGRHTVGLGLGGRIGGAPLGQG